MYSYAQTYIKDVIASLGYYIKIILSFLLFSP